MRILGERAAWVRAGSEALTFAFGLPPILGLSPTGGCPVHAGRSPGSDIATLSRAAYALTAAAHKRPEIGNLISTFRPSVPGYFHRHGHDKLQTMANLSHRRVQHFADVLALYVNRLQPVRPYVAGAAAS